MCNTLDVNDLNGDAHGAPQPQLVKAPGNEIRTFSRQPAVDDAFAETLAIYHDIFEHAPIGIWEEDYSGVKSLIDLWRNEGVDDFQSFFARTLTTSALPSIQ